MREAATIHRLLGDEVRLRILRLLSRERLNVSELTGILAIAQSGVSRHLGLLKDARLVVEERDGGFSYCRLSEPSPGDAPRQALAALLAAQCEAAGDETLAADDARLQEVLRVRRENFETHGRPGAADAGQLVPGRSWAAWARALGHLLPPMVVADLGCGEGYLTIETARWAGKVIAVDRSREVLARARDLARRRGVRNVTWKRGEIEKVPLAAASVNVALLSQALHHAEEPARAVAEAVRITAPGGRVLVLDLKSHDQSWVARDLGDRWLGFEPEQLAGWLEAAGLADVKVGVGARHARDPFTVLVASGRRPEHAETAVGPGHGAGDTTRTRWRRNKDGRRGGLT